MLPLSQFVGSESDRNVCRTNAFVPQGPGTSFVRKKQLIINVNKHQTGGGMKGDLFILEMAPLNKNNP